MRTARDTHVWKVRVLLRTTGQGPSAWRAKTFFYSRQVFADRWKLRAENNANVKIDFYGKYISEEENSG